MRCFILSRHVLQTPMSVMSRDPLEIQEELLSESEESDDTIVVSEMSEQTDDDTADLWAQMEALEDQGATLEEQVCTFDSLCKGKLPSREKETTTHFFIGDSCDADEEQKFDSFWLSLGEPRC